MAGQTQQTEQTEPIESADAERLAEIMQGFASPVRLRILTAIRSRPCTVTELGDALGIGQTTLSNHLRLLRHLSLVSGNRSGRNIHYALADDHVADLLDQAIDHLHHISHDAPMYS